MKMMETFKEEMKISLKEMEEKKTKNWKKLIIEKEEGRNSFLSWEGISSLMTLHKHLVGMSRNESYLWEWVLRQD